MPDYHNELAGTLVNLARLLLDQHGFVQARTLLEQARPHHRAALQANSKNPTYRQFLSNNLASLAPTLVMLGDHVAAATTAEELAGFSWARASDIYNAACALALCVPAAEKDTKLSEAERQRQARTYADRSLALLRQAITKGYKNVAHMKQDPDLKPLHGRPEFQQIVQELEVRTKTGAK